MKFRFHNTKNNCGITLTGEHSFKEVIKNFVAPGLKYTYSLHRNPSRAKLWIGEESEFQSEPDYVIYKE